jgi:hypothetical protein
LWGLPAQPWLQQPSTSPPFSVYSEAKVHSGHHSRRLLLLLLLLLAHLLDKEADDSSGLASHEWQLPHHLHQGGGLPYGTHQLQAALCCLNGVGQHGLLLVVQHARFKQRLAAAAAAKQRVQYNENFLKIHC